MKNLIMPAISTLILAIVGIAQSVMPKVNSWIPSIVLLSAAFLMAIFIAIYWWKQRRKEKIEYLDQKWGFPNANVPYTNRLVHIGIKYDPLQEVQVAQAKLILSSGEYAAWDFHPRNITKPEYHQTWFYLPELETGDVKAKVIVLAGNEWWKSRDFILNVPPAILSFPQQI